jgi:hypothetical protein
MEYTEGLGREAQVWVYDELLTVCDGISSPSNPCPPGLLEDAAFKYVAQQGFSFEQAIHENPSRKKLLEHIHRWTYVGYGQVVSIMPVVIDFGLLKMEDPNWSTNESLVGQFLAVALDRLEIVPASMPDWPQEMA